VSSTAPPAGAAETRFPRSMIRRTGWGLLDQVVSSGTNFAVGVIVARTLPIEDFGAFSIAFYVYTFALTVARAFPMEPLLIRYSASTTERWKRGAAAAIGSSADIGCIAALVLIAVGVVVGGPTGTAFIAIGATLPGLLVQDAWRLAFFAAGRGRDAFLNDVAWGIFLVPAFALAGLAGASLFAITLAWGLAASAAALFGVVQARLVPRPDHALWWWREHDDLGPRFLLEAGIRTGVAQVAMIAIGAIAGLAAIGSIRAAQLIMSPVQVLFLGASLAAVPEAVRALARSLGLLLRLAAGASLALAAASLVWSAAALLIPDDLGRLVLGNAWAAAHAFLPAWIMTQVGAVMTLGPGMTMRAFANARLSLKVTMLTTIVGFVVPVSTAFAGGLAAAWGLAFASVVGAAIWWLAIPSGIRTWQRGRPSTGAAPA
jgi:O-antigen/teichoic acid export membrane protein